jgi:hypothetical protein
LPYHYLLWASVAQLVEQLIRNQQASGSTPLAGSIFIYPILPKKTVTKPDLYWALISVPRENAL